VPSLVWGDRRAFARGGDRRITGGSDMTTTTNLKKMQSRVTRAADMYTSAHAAIAPAAIAWLTSHGYKAIGDAPAIDRPLVRALLAFEQAKDNLQGALDGEPPRPRTRRRRAS
jgi:hypothetical protein